MSKEQNKVEVTKSDVKCPKCGNIWEIDAPSQTEERIEVTCPKCNNKWTPRVRWTNLMIAARVDLIE